MWVTFKPKDRLGNQLFLAASAYSLAKRTGRRLSVHKDTGNETRGKYRYWDSLLSWVPGYEVRPEKSGFIDYVTVTPSTFFNEEGYAGQHVCLQGLFDHPKFFHDYAEDLVRLFQPPNPGTILFDRAGDHRTYVSVHVRRGDFVSLSGCFELLPLSYYVRAMNFMCDYVSGPVSFMVCSDDVEWCRNHLDGERFDLVWSSQAVPALDLWAMSQCDHHIIANSSFSWWSAYLGSPSPSSSKHKVIAPKHWYHVHKYSRAQEPYPKHWWVF